MRFHFRSENHGSIGEVLTESHPSYLVALDAHPCADPPSCPRLLPPMGDAVRGSVDGPSSSTMKPRKNGKQQQPQSEDMHHINPAGDDEDLPTVGLHSKWKHSEHQEDDSHADHVRPRHRQFFRLGRHRSRSSAAASGGAPKSLSPPPTSRRQSRNFVGLRKPVMMTRSVSLPHNLKVVGSTEESIAVSEPCTPRCDAKPKHGHRRHVTFSSVQIREYSRVLGDHPCCPSGPPLSLGWETEREDYFRLEEYELKRDPTRRSKEELRLNCQDRREILESLVVSPNSSDSEGEPGGASSASACCMYSRAEIRKAERRLNRERAENHRTLRKMNNRFFKPVENELSSSSMNSSPVKSEEVTNQDTLTLDPTDGM